MYSLNKNFVVASGTLDHTTLHSLVFGRKKNLVKVSSLTRSEGYTICTCSICCDQFEEILVASTHAIRRMKHLENVNSTKWTLEVVHILQNFLGSFLEQYDNNSTCSRNKMILRRLYLVKKRKKFKGPVELI